VYNGSGKTAANENDKKELPLSWQLGGLGLESTPLKNHRVHAKKRTQTNLYLYMTLFDTIAECIHHLKKRVGGSWNIIKQACLCALRVHVR
jgi:hypothetical protein